MSEDLFSPAAPLAPAEMYAAHAPHLGEPGESALRARIRQWVATAMTRAVCTPIADSDHCTARVPGIRSVIGTGVSESAALAALVTHLHTWAEALLAAGHALPGWRIHQPTVPTEVRGLIRLTRLKRVLRERGRSWGKDYQALPKGAVDAFLRDLDALLARHSASLSTPAA